MKCCDQERPSFNTKLFKLKKMYKILTQLHFLKIVFFSTLNFIALLFLHKLKLESRLQT